MKLWQKNLLSGDIISKEKEKEKEKENIRVNIFYDKNN